MIKRDWKLLKKKRGLTDRDWKLVLKGRGTMSQFVPGNLPQSCQEGVDTWKHGRSCLGAVSSAEHGQTKRFTAKLWMKITQKTFPSVHENYLEPHSAVGLLGLANTTNQARGSLLSRPKPLGGGCIPKAAESASSHPAQRQEKVLLLPLPG